jgi:hypothetical protein
MVLSIAAALLVATAPPAGAEPRTTAMLPSPRTRPVAKGMKGLRQKILGARIKQRGTIDGTLATQTDHYRYVGNGTLERTRSTLKRRVYREGYGGGAEPWDLKVTRREPPRGVRATVIKTRLKNRYTVETTTTRVLEDGVRREPARRKERVLRQYWPTAEDWRNAF